jgi:hypothetical protein
MGGRLERDVDPERLRSILSGVLPDGEKPLRPAVAKG